MLRYRLVALFLAVCLAVFATPALASSIAADGCDDSLFSQMQTSSQAGFDSMDQVVKSLMKPPQSIFNSTCARSNFNIWNEGSAGGWMSTIIGWISSILSSILSAFGISLTSWSPSITLTGASPWRPIIDIIKRFFDGTMAGSLVCQDLWNPVAYAMTAINFTGGTIGINGFSFNPSSFNVTGLVSTTLNSALGIGSVDLTSLFSQWGF